MSVLLPTVTRVSVDARTKRQPYLGRYLLTHTDLDSRGIVWEPTEVNWCESLPTSRYLGAYLVEFHWSTFHGTLDSPLTGLGLEGEVCSIDACTARYYTHAAPSHATSGTYEHVRTTLSCK